jgi:hypothetical protein
MSDYVVPWISIANRLHPVISKQAELVRLAFLQLRELIVKAQRFRPPMTEASVLVLLQPLVAAVRAVESVCDEDEEINGDDSVVEGKELCANHLRLVAGGISALLWVVSNAGCIHVLLVFAFAF